MEIVKQTVVRRFLISIFILLVIQNCIAQQQKTSGDSMMCSIIMGDNFSNDTITVSLNGVSIFEDVQLTTDSNLGLGITSVWAEIWERGNSFYLVTHDKERKINIDPNKIELSFVFKRQKTNYGLHISKGKYLVVDRNGYDKLNFMQISNKPVFD